MRILFAMFQGGGNIPLILPIVTRLVARGHDVRVLAGPGVRNRGVDGPGPIAEARGVRFDDVEIVNEMLGAGAVILQGVGEPATGGEGRLHFVRDVRDEFLAQRFTLVQLLRHGVDAFDQLTYRACLFQIVI